MRVMWTDKRGTEIKLDVQEQRTLRKAGRILTELAKHHATGSAESEAADKIKPVVEKWAKESTDAKK
jgi:hypothetical protein